MSEVLDAPLRECGQETCLAVVTSAFTDDSVERWLYPDGSYARYFPQFAWALGGKAVDANTAWCSEDEAAVAMWLPPGITADEDEVVAVLSATVAEGKHPDMYAALEQMGEAHPVEPHWYLAWLGVERDAQGRGHGADLLTRSLAVVDRSGLPAYLETPNPRTVRFYERHGFAPVGSTHDTGCPPITFMLRPAE